MTESLCYVAGWYSGPAKAETLKAVPGEEFSPLISTRSRGPFKNSGDGPWFCAVKQVDKVRSTDGEVYLKPYYFGDRGANSYVGLSRVDGTSVLAIGHWIGYRQSWCVTQMFATHVGDFIVSTSTQEIDVLMGQKYRQLHNYHPWLINVPPAAEDPEAWISAAEQILDAEPWNDQYVVVRYPNGRWAGVKNFYADTSGVSFNFVNNEMDTFQWASEFGILANGSASRFANAFNDAVEGLDLSQVNSLANIVEGASALVSLARLIRGVFKRDVRSIVQALKTSADPRNLWLEYRYVYTTGRLDLDEYRKTLQRLGDLASVGESISSNGSYADETGSYRCLIKVRTDDIIPKDTVEFLAAIGIEPNAQNLWDMIPWSFVVDWFLHISDVLELVDSWGDAIRLPYTECWMTYRSEYDNQTVTYRIPGRRPDIPPIYVQKQASSKTIKMRIADSIALFLR